MKNNRMKPIISACLIMLMTFTLLLTGCGEPSNLEEHIKSNEALAKELELYSFPGMTTEVSGNTLTFTYEYDEAFDDKTAKLMSKELKDAMETNSDNFKAIKKRFAEETGIDGIEVVITYIDSDGNELCTGEY